jgi:hypothetical protein
MLVNNQERIIIGYIDLGCCRSIRENPARDQETGSIYYFRLNNLWNHQHITRCGHITKAKGNL